MVRATYAAALIASMMVFCACGDDEPEAPASSDEGAAASGDEARPATEATEGSEVPPPPPLPPPRPAPIAGASAENPELECAIRRTCERRCESECYLEERNRKSFFDAKRARVQAAPFTLEVERVYLTGSCARGDAPEKRKATSGISAVIEGAIVYDGDDMLYGAEPAGEAYLRFGSERYVEAPTEEKSYGGYYSRPKKVTRFIREVRGADPWVKGERRAFHWESRPLSEAFCEVTPDEAVAYLELETIGVKSGRKTHPLSFVRLNWDEVVGMAVRTQINVLRTQGKETVEEPADALYASLDKVLVTRLTGKTEWLKRSTTTQKGDLPRGPSAAFPVEASSDEWKVKITGISQAKEFGGYAHDGEDQFLAVIDLEVSYSGEGEGSLKGLSAKLETTPGKWQKPASKALGQLDLDSVIGAGSSAVGKLVFPRQRFERPFRLEVKTPDKNTFYLDVFSYDLGPDRAPE